MVEMSGHQQLTAVKAAAEACVVAGRTDLIVQVIDQAWWNGQAAATTWLSNFIDAERTAPAANSAPPPLAPATRALIGTPGDAAFAKAVEAGATRLRQMYPPRQS